MSAVIYDEKKFIYLFLDSTNQTYNTVSRYSTFQIIANNQQYCPNSFNATYKLKSPIYNVKKIYLKSCEFPVLFNNIRATSLMNNLPIRCSGNLKNLVIPDITFSSVSGLTSYLTTLSASQFPSDNMVFSVHTNGCLKITSITHSSIYMEKSNLSEVLGFRLSIDTLSANTCVSSYKPNLSYDDKVYLFLPEVGNSNSQTNLPFNTSFKIPLSANSGVLNFSTDNSGFSQYIEYYNKDSPLTEITVCVYDKSGYSLHSQGANISFSFCIEYE
jgi:hypothetical protein